MPVFDFALTFWSLALGAFLCAVYDVFRITRLRHKQNSLILFVNDLLYSAIAICSFLILFFNLSKGRIRVYAICFSLIGFLLWRITVSKLVITLLVKLLDFIEAILKRLKTRVRFALDKSSRVLYTKVYSRSAVRGIKKMTFKRKEVDDETIETGTN